MWIPCERNLPTKNYTKKLKIGNRYCGRNTDDFKGLDFDHIELVAIPKADSLLYVQDFRAEERAYQLITQVSGRAGRVSGKGKF
jgi:hypothetical protein